MAVVSGIKCEKCGVQTHVSHSPGDPPPKICGPCSAQTAAEKRTAALAELAALPIEERLARVEAWIYDYRPPRSIYEARF